jgi:hypothetical protein
MFHRMNRSHSVARPTVASKAGAAVIAAAILLLAIGVCGAAVPEQFRVWGGQAKAHPYMADPEAVVVAAPVEASAEETARGFVLFAKPTSFVIAPDFVPAAADRSASLAARDCAGQYGPISLAVLALRPGEFSMSVTDLAGPGGRTIAAENFDVRVVRRIKVTTKGQSEAAPVLLESPATQTVRERESQQFWITYYVPEGTPTGAYTGKVRVLVGGAEKAAVPLTLTVYPFVLAEPGVNLYMYYNAAVDPPDLALIEKELADQRCHGMTMAPMSMPVTRDGDLKRDVLAAVLDIYRKAGFSGHHLEIGLWNRITAEWLNKPDTSIKMYTTWFRYYPFSERLDQRYVETVKFIRDEARRRGLDLVLEVADEPGSHPWTTEATQHYDDLIKRDVPDVLRELTTGGGWAMKRPEDELWKGRINIWSVNRWLPDKMALVRQGDPKAVFQIYNMAGEGSGMGRLSPPRLFFGFFNWKAGVAGAAQWVYYHNGTASHNYTWPAADASQGHVPTVRWEMAREGAKDRRYLATLEQRLGGKTGPAAAEARQFLDELSARIVLKTDEYDPIAGGRIPTEPPGTYDQWRDRAAELIQRL